MPRNVLRNLHPVWLFVDSDAGCDFNRCEGVSIKRHAPGLTLLIMDPAKTKAKVLSIRGRGTLPMSDCHEVLVSKLVQGTELWVASERLETSIVLLD